METKELMVADRVISKIMEENQKTHDTSFKMVKNWLANKICDQLEDVPLIDVIDTFNKV